MKKVSIIKITKFNYKAMYSFQIEALGFIFRMEKYRDNSLKDFFIKSLSNINVFGYYFYLYNLNKVNKQKL
jgi:hypothetical protein